MSIYDVWMNDSSHVTDGASGKVACNSYYLFEKDIEALQILGVNLTCVNCVGQLKINLILKHRFPIIDFQFRGLVFYPMELDELINRVLIITKD